MAAYDFIDHTFDVVVVGAGRLGPARGARRAPRQG